MALKGSCLCGAGQYEVGRLDTPIRPTAGGIDLLDRPQGRGYPFRNVK